MRKRIWLLLWVVGIIFPLAGLGQVSPRFQRAFNNIFGPNWVHVVMHALLFAGLVVLLLVAFGLKPGWRTAGLALLAILLVAGLQEGLQAFSQGIFLFAGAAYDFGVDLLGGSTGYTLYHLLSSRNFANRQNP
jgi:hypothetical protein